jgi:hypothetical protein
VVGESVVLRWVLRWVLTPLAGWARVREEAAAKGVEDRCGGENEDVAKESDADYSMWKLVPTLRYDYQLTAERRESKVLERAGVLNERDMDVLLMSADGSPAYLQESVGELEKVIPKARHVRSKGLDHSVFENMDQGGRSVLMVDELKRFLVGDSN